MSLQVAVVRSVHLALVTFEFLSIWSNEKVFTLLPVLNALRSVTSVKAVNRWQTFKEAAFRVPPVECCSCQGREE